MFGLQREGTVLKGRGRSQCGEHEKEELQVDRGLAECPAVMLSDPQSMSSAGRGGGGVRIQSFPSALCEKADYMNTNCTSKKSKCVCSGRGTANTDEEGGKLEKLIPDYISGVDFESLQLFIEKSHSCSHLLVLGKN